MENELTLTLRLVSWYVIATWQSSVETHLDCWVLELHKLCPRFSVSL